MNTLRVKRMRKSTMVECIFDHSPYLGINEIFNEAQREVNSHPRLRKELTEIYEQNETVDFIMEFLQCLSKCLVISEKYPCVEKALDFASVFLAQHYQDKEDLLVAVFEFIFKNHSCKTQAVRFRCCELMNRLLHSMDDQAGLYDDIFEKIASTMLERLQDKIPSIRAQAVMALQRLQNPQDQSCPIIKAFLFHMERDPSHDVRAKVVKHIAVTPRTLPVLFGRTSDVNVTVKKEAYKALSRLRAVKLSIKQRQKICAAGVSDKSETVKSFVLNNLVLSWFKQCDLDYITFLKMLYVETINEGDLEKIVFHLFKKQPSSTLIETVSNYLSKEKLIPVRQLTPENVTLWLLVIKYFSKSADDDLDKDLVGNIIPELTKFSKYLKDYAMILKKNNMENEFIVSQLFKIAATYSFDDEMGREQMRQMCINYMMDENVGKNSIPAIAKAFQLIVPSVKERMVMMAEVISDIREPLHNSQISDEVVGVLNQLAQLSCESLETERDLKNDPETLIKCLTIIIEFFKAKDVKEIDATLLTLKDIFVKECFTRPEVEVQNLAQDVMSFYCIWNLNIAKENFLKFIFQISNELTCLSAMRCVVDILLVHGFHPFALQNGPTASAANRNKGPQSLDDLSNDSTLTPTQVFLVSLLISLLENENAEIRAQACQGLAKLMLCGHLSSPLVLARLVLIWFNPSTASQPEIRHPIGIFLNVYTTKRRDAGTVVLNCIIPALRAVHDMPAHEDEEIDPLSVGKLLVSLLRADVCSPPSNIKQEGSYHLQLATRICKELLITNGCDPLVLGKLLPLIDFQPEDGKLCGNLLLLVCRGIKKMGKFWDKKVLKTMQGLKVKLEEMKAKSKELGSNSQESIHTSASDVTRNSLMPIVEEDSSASHPDVSASYSASQAAGNRVDDSDIIETESPKEAKVSSSGNMVVDETMDEAGSFANAPDDAAPLPEQPDESDGEVIPAQPALALPTPRNIISDSDREDESDGEAIPAKPEDAPSKPRKIISDSDSEDESDGESIPAKPEVAPTKPLKIISDSDSEDESDGEAIPAKPHNIISDSDSEDESEESSESASEDVSSKKRESLKRSSDLKKNTAQAPKRSHQAIKEEVAFFRLPLVSKFVDMVKKDPKSKGGQSGGDTDGYNFYYTYVREMVLNNSNDDEKRLASCWITAMNEHQDRKGAVVAIKLLLLCLSRRSLDYPFSEEPPSNAEDWLCFFENPNIKENEWASLVLASQGPSGPKGPVEKPPVVTSISSDFTEYVAAQEIPNFGIHCYYATSPEPIDKWNIPPGKRVMDKDRTNPLAWEKCMAKISACMGGKQF